MPANNQHVFTCAACGLAKPRDQRCLVSGWCGNCCGSRAQCAADCDRCGVRYRNCVDHNESGPVGVAGRCGVCQRHATCTAPDDRRPLSTHRCRCRVCTTCGVKKSLEYFYQHGPVRAECVNCHQQERANHACMTHGHCSRCNSATDDSNPIRSECCGYCAGCCVERRCNGKSSIEWSQMPMVSDSAFGQAPVKKLSKKTQFKFNPIRRTLGYEIECSSYKNGRKVSKAVESIGGAVVSDGSVSSGFEINTPPMNGDVLVHGLAYLSESLIDSEAKANAAAGLHIHVDCTDMEYDDMRRMIMLYGRLESGLFSIISASRMKGNYSKPNGGRMLLKLLSDPKTARKDIITMVYAAPPKKGWEEWTKGKNCNGDRYWAMNVHSWFLRGTVEFRLHHGTVRWEKMLGMGMVLGAIADNAIRLSEQEIIDYPQGKEGLIKIAPTDWCKAWVKDRWDHFAKGRKHKDEPIADF